MKMINNVLMPVKYKNFYAEYSNSKFTLLDVGCGNHSPSKTKKWFPKCEYYGIDNGVYSNDEKDFNAMKKFFEIDLIEDVGKLAKIPNEFFDVVILAHVIEHLPNGLDIISIITDKLKPGGSIYLEFPSVKSLSLPSMDGTLHFCDDPTHVRLYEISEVSNLLLLRKFKIIRAGTRRDIGGIVLIPLGIIYSLWVFRKIKAAVFWDITGFASYVYAKKN